MQSVILALFVLPYRKFHKPRGRVSLLSFLSSSENKYLKREQSEDAESEKLNSKVVSANKPTSQKPTVATLTAM